MRGEKLYQQGLLTRSDVQALHEQGFAAPAIAERLKITRDRVLVILTDLGLRERVARTPYGPRPGVAGGAIFEDRESLLFRERELKALAAHERDIRLAYGRDFRLTSLVLPESDYVPTLRPPAGESLYTSPGALCADSTDGAF